MDTTPFPGPPSRDLVVRACGALAVAASILFVVAGWLPYLRFAQGDLSDPFAVQAIFACHFPGCGWYSVELWLLALITMIVGISLVAALRVRVQVAATALIVLALWALSLFLGYYAGPRNEPGTEGGSGGLVGVLGSVTLAAAAILYSARAASSMRATRTPPAPT